MKETMVKYNQLGKTNYNNNNFGILNYIRSQKYTPQNLENYSPYEEDFTLINLISAVGSQRGEVLIIDNQELIELDKAQEQFEQHFNDILNNESGIYLVKVPTGFGKTKVLESLNNTTICLPTHKLKNEVSERMQVVHKVSPVLPKLDDETNKRIEYLYSIGLNEKVSELLNELENKTNMTAALVKQYRKDNLDVMRYSGTVLTTHTKGIYNMFKNNTIIFDEDPLNQLIKVKTLKIGDLITMEVFPETKNEIAAMIDYLRNKLPAGQIVDTPLFAMDYDSLVDNVLKTNIESNLIDFMDSQFIYKDVNDVNLIHFIIKNNALDNLIQSGKKIIIMSATASTTIWSKLVQNIQIFDLMNVKQQGKIIQHTKLSFSRSSLNAHRDIVDKVGDLPAITFAEYKNLFNNPVKDMHFGNCSGYNSLNGQDIAVVGTPHLPNFIYLLYAKVLGATLTSRDSQTTMQQITWNGFRFKFNTYKNEMLREVQLALIESELVQAVGRNRTLRNNCITHLYSNLPLKSTTEFTKK
jgi:hypothetical protein